MRPLLRALGALLAVIVLGVVWQAMGGAPRPDDRGIGARPSNAAHLPLQNTQKLNDPGPVSLTGSSPVSTPASLPVRIAAILEPAAASSPAGGARLHDPPHLHPFALRV